jgi:hypothetical protein
MVLLGFGSGCSVLSQFFDGATEAPQSRRPSTFLHKTQSAVSAGWVFACWRYPAKGYPLVELGLRTKGNDAAAD